MMHLIKCFSNGLAHEQTVSQLYLFLIGIHVLLIICNKGKGKKLEDHSSLEKSFPACIYKMKVYHCLSNNSVLKKNMDTYKMLICFSSL